MDALERSRPQVITLFIIVSRNVCNAGHYVRCNCLESYDFQMVSVDFFMRLSALQDASGRDVPTTPDDRPTK